MPRSVAPGAGDGRRDGGGGRRTTTSGLWAAPTPLRRRFFLLPLALLLLAVCVGVAAALGTSTRRERQQERRQRERQLQQQGGDDDKEAPTVAGAATWEVPAKQLSACKTASESMQRMVGAAPGGMWTQHPTAEQWREILAKSAEARLAQMQDLQGLMGMEMKEATLGGVTTYTITPPTQADPDRLLVHLHGGGYLFNGGPAGAIEAAFIANATRTTVVSVDYRQPPAHPFPAALDDAVAAWTEAVKGHDPSKIGLLGTSAGGGLAMATALRLKDEGKAPLPAALYLSTPWSDLSDAGDSYTTLAFVDNKIVTHGGALGDAAAMYANGKDLKDPYLSPVYGDVSGFPPTLLMTGTRDLFLSNTVRVHRKLRQAGVQADLHVFEGLSHAQHIPLEDPVRLWKDPPPETRDALGEVAAFFERTLGQGPNKKKKNKSGGGSGGGRGKVL